MIYDEQAKLADALREALAWIGQTRGELPGENERRGSNDERRRILEKGWDALKEHPFIKSEIREVCAQADAAIARTEKAEAALAKINAIRDSIIGAQNINWSEHIYPLVAALNEAGFQGTPHKVARENLGTLIEQVKAAETRADAAEKRVAELEECHHIVEGYSQKVYAAGIREGLERAAVRVGDPNTRQTWLEPRFATALAKELRAMKEQVK